MVSIFLWQHGDRIVRVSGWPRETQLHRGCRPGRCGWTARGLCWITYSCLWRHGHGVCSTRRLHARGLTTDGSRPGMRSAGERQRHGRARRARSWRLWCRRASWACRRPFWRGPQPAEALTCVSAHSAGLSLTAVAPGRSAARRTACAARVMGRPVPRRAHHLPPAGHRVMFFPAAEMLAPVADSLWRAQ